MPGVHTSKQIGRHNLQACKKENKQNKNKTTFTCIYISYSAGFSDALKGKSFERNATWM